jgi:hypothetical protein
MKRVKWLQPLTWLVIVLLAVPVQAIAQRAASRSTTIRTGLQTGAARSDACSYSALT